MVGSSGPANFIVSTLAEGENLLPFMLECQREGRECSVSHRTCRTTDSSHVDICCYWQILYGVPPAQSAMPRLVNLASKLKPGSVHILIDNIEAFNKMREYLDDGRIGVFIKVDTGYHRAGIEISSAKFPRLVRKVVGM